MYSFASEVTRKETFDERFPHTSSTKRRQLQMLFKAHVFHAGKSSVLESQPFNTCLWQAKPKSKTIYIYFFIFFLLW